MTHNLSRLIRPQSIAVFGGSWSKAVVTQCQIMEFEGEIWPVHPSKSEICGLKCYASVDDLPDAPDASFIGVNRMATLPIVADLARRGAGGAVCFASGFGEVEDGAALQDELVAAAGDMPILGPNCYGYINYLEGVLLWPDQHGGRRVTSGVAIIAQSSNVAINLTMQNRGLPIAYMMTVGNQAQTGLPDMIEAMLEDPAVTAIGLYIEGFKDIVAIEAALRKAWERRIPVVALKAGVSVAAQAVTLSHTASLSGANDLISAFFKRLNVARVKSIDELLETLKLLHVLGPSSDHTLGSLSCSGGEAAIMGDLAQSAGLDLRSLTSLEIDKVSKTLPGMVTISNPLDYHTFSWGDEASLTQTYASMLSCGFGLTCLILDIPRPDRCVDNGSEAAVQAAIAAVKLVGGRLALVASLPENMHESLADRLIAENIAPMSGLQTAVMAAKYAAQIGAGFQAEPPEILIISVQKPSEVEAETLDEWQSKSILRALGIATPQGELVQSAEQAVVAADKLGYPIVLKAVSSKLAHKTELGAVVLNLNSALETREAAQSLEHLEAPLLVEKMVCDAIAEIIIGIARDGQFGLYLTIGAGGIMVELLKDVSILLLPVSRNDVRTALLSLKSAALLTGFRNIPAVDLEAVIDAAMVIAQYAIDENQTLEELDINPLIATVSGAYAADALIRRRMHR